MGSVIADATDGAGPGDRTAALPRPVATVVALVVLEPKREEQVTDQKTYSVQLRVQRVIREDAFISVPVTAAVLRQADDGTQRIDSEAFLSAALLLARDPQVAWQQESIEVVAHPLQIPLPDDRKVFAGLFPGD